MSMKRAKRPFDDEEEEDKDKDDTEGKGGVEDARGQTTKGCLAPGKSFTVDKRG
jgi:hypothetical protein